MIPLENGWQDRIGGTPKQDRHHMETQHIVVKPIFTYSFDDSASQALPNFPIPAFIARLVFENIAYQLL